MFEKLENIIRFATGKFDGKGRIYKMHKFVEIKQKVTNLDYIFMESYPQLKARKYRKNELYTKLFTLSTKFMSFFRGKKPEKTNGCFGDF